MDIRSKLRKALLAEGAHKAKKFGCVMVFLDYDKSEWKSMQDVIDDKDLYEPEDETGFGKEKDPHVTILFGLHSDVSDSDIKDEIGKLKKPKLKLGKVSSFTNDKFDVLKYDVEGEDLHKANKKFCEYPHTNSFPDYHPHCTIAYVKKGKADKYIKLLNDLEMIHVSVDKFVYSKADGKKLEFDI